MNARSLLILSIGANVALAATAGYLLTQKPKSAPTTEAGPAKATAAPGTMVITNINSAAPGQKFDWRAVESEDYRRYIANLRAIGCPEETIKDIIIADVNKLFEDRKKELKSANAEKFEFWKTGIQSMMGNLLDEEAIKERQALAAEKRALLKELLGIDIVEPAELAQAFNPMDRMLDFLEPEQRNKVMELYTRYQAKAMKSFSGGVPDAEDMKAMQQARKDMEAELKTMMTPQQFEDYQLRMSETSMTMRMMLDGFEPNEQEFRDIFKLRKDFDDKYGMMGFNPGDTDSMKERGEAESKMNEELKKTLGEERFKEYTMNQDFAYKIIAKATAQQGLPKESASHLYDTMNTAKATADTIRNDVSLSEEDRYTKLKAVQAATKAEMRGVLGDGYERYRKNPQNWWINNLAPEHLTAPTEVPALEPLPE
jgi:hypothetical protein